MILKVFLYFCLNFSVILIITLINNMVNGEEYIESQTLIEDEVKHKGKFDLKTELIAGTLAGVSSCILFYPLECIEAKLQVQSSTGTQAAMNIMKESSGKRRPPTMGFSTGGGATANTIGPFSMAKNIIRSDGIKGFYQGVSPTVLGNAVNWGVYFSIYRATNHWWNMPNSITGQVYQGPAWVGHSVSAITAGIITTAIVNPFWVLKIRLATTKKYSGIQHAFKSILNQEGIGGFWKGVGISFIGVSEGLFQFVSYEYILDQIRLSNPSIHQPLTVSNYLFAGGTARLIAGCITYPYLLIRSTLQSEPCQYKNMGDAIKGIYRSEGIKGFYKGIGPNLARSVPPAAFMLYIVEFFRNILTS